MNNYAVITGAAGGLGKAFGYELSKKGINTLLIDLPKKELKNTCLEIEKKFGTKSIFYEADLSQIENIIAITNEINKKYDISILINNVGLGGTLRFDDATINYLNTIIQLNVMATTIVTKQLLSNLKQQQRSYVLTISSMAAFSPMPFKTVYPASKSFVDSFSKGLYEEYKNQNISFSVVHPGPMRTNPEITARINKQSKLGRTGLLSPEKVAEISIKQLFKGKMVVKLNFSNRFNWLLMRIIPTRIQLPLLARIFKKELK